ncbi:hypothetical protein [Rhodococcus chondri]|uniref:Uncharacterized protein n=1 Tax=Rhodococcus chondri TaxID=3065941 RepID=A0ABU7JND6_9NOCA|nr:hypothetical protein [Rhodococcus sp. CC-R104]MEE2031330.1 hypothetical protein [Rhodococcus sp. CC-R104]
MNINGGSNYSGSNYPESGIPGRMHVRLSVAQRYGEEDDAPLSDWGRDRILEVGEAIPEVCALHGLPEVRRYSAAVSSMKNRMSSGVCAGDRRLFGDLADPRHPGGRRKEFPTYTMGVEWPLCARCARIATIATIVAVSGMGLGIAMFLCPLLWAFWSGASLDEYPALPILMLVAFPVMFVGSQAVPFKQSWVGLEFPIDGSFLLVPDAHPNFVRAVQGLRAEAGRNTSPGLPDPPRHRHE